VGLFHPRLHAGLSRRLRSLPVAARNPTSADRRYQQWETGDKIAGATG
jgi:hypothetical protein